MSCVVFIESKFQARSRGPPDLKAGFRFRVSGWNKLSAISRKEPFQKGRFANRPYRLMAKKDERKIP